MQPPFEFEHSVEVNASAETAWEFWTKGGNWHADQSTDWVTTDDVLASGAVGDAEHLDLPFVRSRVAESRAAERAVLEAEMPGVTFRFEMSFEPVSESRTRLRQRVTLTGPHAAAAAPLLGPMFEQSIRDGLQSLADAIAERREP
ncbi:MAG TPA: SRPBCC family protein [Pyrinomonadaceae bacterium]|nr:SRPBCC family protein [Pyrinomonadaceae bacterium]